MPLHTVLVRPPMDSCMPVSPGVKKDSSQLEPMQRWDARMSREIEGLFYKRRQKELGLFRLQRDLTVLYEDTSGITPAWGKVG